MIRPTFLRILGGYAQPWTHDQLIAGLLERAETGSGALAGGHNLHSLALCRTDARMRRFYSACDLVFIDGMAVVLAGRLQGQSLSRHHRHTVLDWLPSLLNAMAQRRLRWFHVGSPPGIAERGMAALRDAGLVPVLPEHAAASGYFDPAPGSVDNQALLQRINAFSPHVLTVGMGMPRQERWLVENIAGLRTGVAVAIGAVLEYHAGVQRTPPRWMGRAGLEWLSRLASDPRRLGHRYLIEPWGLMPRFVADVLVHRAEQSATHPPW